MKKLYEGMLFVGIISLGVALILALLGLILNLPVDSPYYYLTLSFLGAGWILGLFGFLIGLIYQYKNK